MVTGLVIAGKAEPRSMVRTPVPLIAKSIVLGPVVLLDWVMAYRRVPVAVVSAVLVTVRLRVSSGEAGTRPRPGRASSGKLLLFTYRLVVFVRFTD